MILLTMIRLIMIRLIMIRLIVGVFFISLALQVSAQQQQAGNAASSDTEGTFQALIDACDDVDALMLRARIRLQLPRTTEDAAGKAESMLEQAFATCGGGDLEGAKAQLTEALSIAEAGVSEKFEMAETTVAAQEASVNQGNGRTDETDDASDGASPWWKFW
ncbi:MAG: hypothetical protein KTR32_32740 [Granulosicoccus sp.]|nr:hypothetical protein [Granulosicoccus sp.]